MVVGNIDKDLRESERETGRESESERRRKRLNIAVCSLLISCLDFCGKAVRVRVCVRVSSSSICSLRMNTSYFNTANFFISS